MALYKLTITITTKMIRIALLFHRLGTGTTRVGAMVELSMIKKAILCII